MRREVIAGHALVEASPAEGRTHQIRVHCTENGFPVVGDPLYGRGRNPAKIRGLDTAVAEPPCGERMGEFVHT